MKTASELNFSSFIIFAYFVFAYCWTEITCFYYNKRIDNIMWDMKREKKCNIICLHEVNSINKYLIRMSTACDRNICILYILSEFNELEADIFKHTKSTKYQNVWSNFAFTHQSMGKNWTNEYLNKASTNRARE